MFQCLMMWYSRNIHLQGAISTSRALDHETQPIIIVTLTAQDNGVPPRQGVTSITFYITDINDNPPMFDASFHHFSIYENVAIGARVGKVIAQDNDQGVNSELRYAIATEGKWVVHYYSPFSWK